MNWHESIDMNDLKMKELKRINENAWIVMNELKWRNWTAWIETHELTWMNWDEWIDMNELTWMNWNEWVDMKELRWMNCHEGIDMNELKRMNRHETIIMKELKHMTWNAWIDMNIFESNELTWVNWNEWIDMTGLTLKNWTEWIEMNDLSTSSWRSGPSPSVFCVFYVKSSSGYSPVHILSTSSSKIWSEPVRFWRFLCDQLLDDDVVDRWNGAVATVVRTLCRPHCQPHLQKCQTHLNFSAILFMWNRALASVSCTFCRPHLQKVQKKTVSFSRFLSEIELSLQFVRILSTIFRIKARNRGNKDPPAATADGHFTRKNRRFCSRASFQPWIHAVPIAHTPNYLVMIMMWLTWWLRWWCGCHDGETASRWQSSVLGSFLPKLSLIIIKNRIT